MVLLVGYVASSVGRERSEDDPLDSFVRTPSPNHSDGPPSGSPVEYGPEGFQVLVDDASQLPPNISEIDSCARLWEIGKSAGGTRVHPEAEPPPIPVEVKGRAETGTRIVGMRARVTEHAPTPNGVLLVCPPEPLVGGPQEPLHITFDFDAVDLGSVDLVPAHREGSPMEGEDARQFEDGFSISLSRNESVQLLVSTVPAPADVTWHIEAEVLVDGELQVIRIPDDGENLVTQGTRSLDDYQEGHSAEEPGWNNGPALDWGVDAEAKLVRAQGDGQALRWRNVTIPYTEGLEVYIPYGTGNGFENAYREIRREGRTLILFNPPAVEVWEEEVSPRTFCMVGTRPGMIHSVEPTRSQMLKHQSAHFEHRTTDYICRADDGTEQTYRQESAQRTGSSILFRTALDPATTDQDRALARSILRSLQDDSE